MVRTETQPTPLAELLVRLRRAAGVSQERLAHQTGLSERAIRDLERGATNRPRRMSLDAISAALNLGPDERRSLIAAAGGRPPQLGAPAPAMAEEPIVGRERELATLLDLVRGGRYRLISLTGPGGVGKSRLLHELSRVLRTTATPDVRHRDMSTAPDPTLVAEEIAEALGVGGGSWLDPVGRAAAALRGRQVVLILDGFERLLPAAEVVRELVARCPGLTVVVASRVPLRLHGERQVRLDGLAVPEPRAVGPRRAGPGRGEAAALTLLLRLADLARPGFTADPTDLAALARVCRLVDGLPLALELAAARLRLLSPTELVARLDSQLDLLAGGPAGGPDRHRSLRATLEYSLEVVAADARTLFAWLTAFPGGAGLTDLEACAERLGRDRIWLLEALGELLDAGLLRARPHDNRTRYELPDAMRELAGERLADGPDLARVTGVVARHYLGRLRAAGAGRTEFQDLHLEHGNIRAAVGWTLANDVSSMDNDTVEALFLDTLSRGRFAEGRACLCTLAAAGVRAAGYALVRAATLSDLVGDAEGAARLAAEGLRQLTENDVRGWIVGRLLLGRLAAIRGDDASAAAYLADALTLARQTGDDTVLGPALHDLAAVHAHTGDYTAAEATFAEAATVKRRAGRGRLGIGCTMLSRAQVALSRANWVEARALAAEAGDIVGHDGHPRLRAVALSVLALAHVWDDHTGSAVAAIEAAAESVRLDAELGRDDSLRGLIHGRAGVVHHATGGPGVGKSLRCCAQLMGSGDDRANLALIVEAHSALIRDGRRAVRLLGIADGLRRGLNRDREPASIRLAGVTVHRGEATVGSRAVADERAAGAALADDAVVAALIDLIGR
jgi:predicted ATPase/DNA-binding XRE family transcriptional regulator